MGIEYYKGIPQSQITKLRITSDGKPYTLEHSKELLVPMKYFGDTKTSVNSLGWQRDSNYYFNEISKQYPQCLSKHNIKAITEGNPPIVDKIWVKHFPQHKPYMDEELIHHHVGKGGMAAAVPIGMHKGSGEIHNGEKEAGIMEKAEQHTESIKTLCHKDKSLYGKDAEELTKILNAQKKQIKATAITDAKHVSHTKQKTGRLPNALSTKNVQVNQNLGKTKQQTKKM